MIIFQQFDKKFDEIANIVIPHNKQYCDLFNKQYIDFHGSFDEFYTEISHGIYKEYWTKIILLKHVLEQHAGTNKWIVMIDGDIILDHAYDISVIPEMISEKKHIAICRATDDIKEYWNINIGSMIVRNSEVSRKIIDKLIVYGKNKDFNVYEQQMLQYILKHESYVSDSVEVFPPLSFNHTGGPYLFHPCGAGFTTANRDYHPNVAIQNKINVIKQRISDR